jgi:hypothetical protein
MLNCKTAVTPIFPLLATSAQPHCSVDEVPGLCAKYEAPGARVPDKTPGAEKILQKQRGELRLLHNPT